MAADYTFNPTNKDDFVAVYNLPDPRPYYTGLEPSGYRMPEVVGACTARLVAWIESASALSRPVRVLDFASGFGAAGAVMRHGLSMADIYAYYGATRWSPDAPEAHREADRAWYDANRIAQPPNCEIIGADIADVALAYGLEMGLIDISYAADLVSEPLSHPLDKDLDSLDLVIETGAVAPVQPPAFTRLLEAGARPWFLRSPRPDISWKSLDAVFERFDYVDESVGPPVGYRRALSDAERTSMLDGARAAGIEHDVFVDDYLAVTMKLSRPRADAQKWPLAALLAECNLLALCR